jgi:hypothetical protein
MSRTALFHSEWSFGDYDFGRSGDRTMNLAGAIRTLPPDAFMLNAGAQLATY